MSTKAKMLLIGCCVLFAALSATLSEASARGRLFPLTQCGPGQAYFCPIKGYFDLAPFKYSLAIYPGCLQTQRIQTPKGVQRQLVLVCG